MEASLETVMFKSQKTVMLSLHLISNQKAKSHLMLIHAQLLIKYLSQFSKKLEQIHKSCQDEEKKKSIAEFLGTTYVALNQIQQIKYEFQNLNDALKE